MHLSVSSFSTDDGKSLLCDRRAEYRSLMRETFTFDRVVRPSYRYACQSPGSPAWGGESTRCSGLGADVDCLGGVGAHKAAKRRLLPTGT